MTRIPTYREIHELIEDKLEEATGEPRHVTDVEIDLIPSQDARSNWEVGNYDCKPEYRAALDNAIDEVQRQFPILEF